MSSLKIDEEHRYYPNFSLLSKWVIEKGICCYCGTCSGVCPRIELNGRMPKLVDYCSECGNCYTYCPQTYTPIKSIENEIFKNAKFDIALGYYLTCIAAQSTDKNVLSIAQNGGLVTTLLLHAMEIGMIDAAVVTIRDENWMPRPIVARTPEEIKMAAGSKYVMSPTVSAYRQVISDPSIKRVAFVGLPCQVRALRKLERNPMVQEAGGKIELIISLLCHRNFSYDCLFKNIIEERFGVKPSEIKKMDIWKGMLMVYTKDGKELSLPVRELRNCIWPSCEYCTDFTGILADISVGNAGLVDNDWSLVLIRSEKALKLVDSAIKLGRLKFVERPDAIVMLAKDAQKKMLRREKVEEDIIQIISELGIPAEEVRVYTTLLTIGSAYIDEIVKATGIERKNVEDTLLKLIDRGWIVKEQERYIPLRPSKVLRIEANRLQQLLKKVFEKESELEGIYARKIG